MSEPTRPTAIPGRIQPTNTLTASQAIDRFRAPADGYQVQLLRPFSVSSRHSYSTTLTLPIGLAYLASVVELAGYGVSVIDAIGEDLLNITRSDCGRFNLQGLSVEAILRRIDADTRVLGVSMMFSQEWVQHRDLIRAIRRARPDLVIVVGGEHPTAMWDYVLNDCLEIDYLVRGEGEIAFLELLHDLSHGGDGRKVGGVTWRAADGTLGSGELSRRLADINDMPRPAWHLFEMERYFTGMWTAGIAKGRNVPILATRGCPYQCTFCSNTGMWTTRYIMRDPIKVVDEIEDLIHVHRADSIEFFDLTAFVQKKWILTFCNEIIGRGLKFDWQLPSGTRSEALDEEALRALHDAGCSLLVFAPESGDERTLEVIKKKLRLESIGKSIRTAVDVGFSVKINLVIGFPHERRGSVLKSVLYAVRTAFRGVHDCNVSLFTPYPGSELFRELRAEGRIGEIDDDYFANLITQFDFTQTNAYCRHIGGRELGLYRFIGLAGFYSLSYLSHRRRIWRAARSMLGPKFQPANIFEQRIYDYVCRMRLLRASAGGGQ